MSAGEDVIGALARVVRVLEDHGVRDFAFTGGVAVGVWVEPRQTKDVDVCGVLPAQEVNRPLAVRDGMRTGTGELPDRVRFRVGDWDVDLFVSKGPYDRVLERARTATVGNQIIRVVSPEDLLIHKLIKLRSDKRRMLQDLADMRGVCEHHELDWDYLEQWLPDDERGLLSSVTELDDEAMVSRLLGKPGTQQSEEPDGG